MLHRLAELDPLVRAAYADFDLQAHLRRAQRLHDVRSVGVLFRYPQRRALLRPLFLANAQSLPDRARPAISLHGHLACAHAVLHRRRGVAGARPGGDFGAPRTVPGGAGLHGATMRLPKSGASSAACAGSLPARSNLSGRPSASAPRSKPRRSIYVADADLFDCGGRCRSRRIMHHVGRHVGRGRWAPLQPSGSTTCAALRSSRAAPQGRKCARSWKITEAVGLDPQFPDVTPRDAQALREWEAMRNAAE